MVDQASPIIEPKVSSHAAIDKSKMAAIAVAFVITSGGFLIWSVDEARQVTEDAQETLDEGAVALNYDAPSRSDFEQQVGRELANRTELKRVPSTPDSTTKVAMEAPKPDGSDAIRQKLRQNFLNRAVGKAIPTLAPEPVADPLTAAKQAYAIEELNWVLRASRETFRLGDGRSNDGSSENTPTDPTARLTTRVLKSRDGTSTSVDSLLANDPGLDRVQKQSQYVQQQLAALSAGGAMLPAPATPDPFSASFTPSAPLEESLNGDEKVLLSGTPDNPAFPDGYAGSNATFYTEPPGDSVVALAGTVVPIVLQTHLNSDNPGEVLARIENDVYDKNGHFVLIPAGSKVLGHAVKVSSTNAVINHRIGVTANTVVRPDGLKIDLANKPLLDAMGQVGVTGDVNHHFLKKTLAAVGFFAATYVPTMYVHDSLGRRKAAQARKQQPTDSDANASDSGSGNGLSTNIPVSTDDCEITSDESTSDVVHNNPDDPHVTDPVDPDDPVVTTTEPPSDEPCVDDKPAPTVVVTTGVTTTTTTDTKSLDTQGEITREFATNLTNIFTPIFDDYFKLKPTINVAPGTKMNLVLTADIYAKPWTSVYAKYVN